MAKKESKTMESKTMESKAMESKAMESEKQLMTEYKILSDHERFAVKAGALVNSGTLAMAALDQFNDGVKMEVSGACHNYVTASGLTLAATCEKEWSVIEELRSLAGIDKGVTLARAIVLYRAKQLELDKAVSKKTVDGDVKSVKMSIASFAETFCGLKGASANIYLNTVDMFYNVTDESFALKDGRYNGIAFSVLSLLLGPINKLCGGSAEEFFTDFCTGDNAILKLHGRSQSEVKAQLKNLRGGTSEVTEESKPEESKPEESKSEESKPEVSLKKRVIEWVAQTLTLTDNEEVAAIVNKAIEDLNKLDI